jgi:hypothetical protein
MPEVMLGKDATTGQPITIGDVERYGGFYVRGKPQYGKSHLLIYMALQDIKHGHGLLFIDPHIDAIREILDRMTPDRAKDVILLDPAVKEHSFSINPLYCSQPDDLDEQLLAFAQARDVFAKAFDTGDQQLGVWLRKYLLNSLYPLIENPGYTLYDLWEFLKEKDFRDALLANVKSHREIVKFWHEEFDRMPRRDREREIQAVLTRIDILRANHVINYMISQAKPTVDFVEVMQQSKIVLLRIPPKLDEESRSFIGTLVLSQFLKAIALRAEVVQALRTPFAIYVDEMQTFATPDFAKLFAQTGKFKIMPHGAHQVREGQLRPDDPTRGATSVAPNIALFAQANDDSTEYARLLSNDPPTEIRLERQLAISKEPFQDLLRGHNHPEIHRFVQQYLHPLRNQLEDTQDDIEGERLLRQALIDEAAISRTEQQREAFYNSLARGRTVPVSFTELEQTKQTLEEVRRHTDTLLRLHESARALKLSIRSLNTFLTAIMEGRIQPEPGQELFSQFLLAFVPLAVPLPKAVAPAFALYVSLVYGNPSLPRAIPVTLAAKYQGITHEELYRQVEAQYTRQVLAYAEGARQESEAERTGERQDHYEKTLREIMTWKHLMGSLWWTTDRECFRLLQYRQVRSFLTPYLFARFAPPWYYYDPNGRPPTLFAASAADATPEERQYADFVRNYGEGAAVALAFLRAAFRGRRMGSTNRVPAYFGPGANLPLTTPGYAHHLHMMELPAIAGMEPFRVWQVIRQLSALLHTLAAPNQSGFKVLHLVSLGTWAGYPPELDLDERTEAQLLLAQIDADFPDAAQLRTWWDRLTDEDLRCIGRRKDVLVWRLQVRYSYSLIYAQGEVRGRLMAYKKEKHSGESPQVQLALPQRLPGAPSFQGEQQGLPMPYVLERVWHRLDEPAQMYLIARACDLVAYGEVVADRTFPQPTLDGIPPQEVSAAVAALMMLLMEAKEQLNAASEQAWVRRKEDFVRECLWKYDGLLRLQVYQAEGRVRMRDTVERYLPARVLTAEEKTVLTDACQKELSQDDGRGQEALAVLAAFVRFSQLLRLPENHVRGQTAQYVEKEVNTYPTREMIEQRARELTRLLPRTAYCHVLQASGEGQVIRQAKIRTLPLPEPHGQPLEEAIMRDCLDRVYRPYAAIESEIRQRQEQWRNGVSAPSPRRELPRGRTKHTPDRPPPPVEEPPPVQTRGSKPPEPEEPPRKRLKNTARKAAKRPQVPRKWGR